MGHVAQWHGNIADGLHIHCCRTNGNASTHAYCHASYARTWKWRRMCWPAPCFDIIWSPLRSRRVSLRHTGPLGTAWSGPTVCQVLVARRLTGSAPILAPVGAPDVPPRQRAADRAPGHSEAAVQCARSWRRRLFAGSPSNPAPAGDRCRDVAAAVGAPVPWALPGAAGWAARICRPSQFTGCGSGCCSFLDLDLSVGSSESFL